MGDIRTDWQTQSKLNWGPSDGVNTDAAAALALAKEYQSVGYARPEVLVSESLSSFHAIFLDIVERFRDESDPELTLSYAAEWILDNDYLVIAALRQVEEALPPAFEKQLPQLSGAAQAGILRVHALALSFVQSNKASLDLERVRHFLSEFQKVTPLTMGELWALPIFLRLSVVRALILSAALSTGLSARLEPGFSLGLVWNAEEDEEIIANVFLSLRTLAAEDWKDFFEELSLVDQLLKRDPLQVYGQMDFETRDRYRKVVEQLARATGQDEQQVAQEAIHLAQGHFNPLSGVDPSDTLQKQRQLANLEREAHVGFYLLAVGRQELEARLGYHPAGSERFKRWSRARAVPIYLLTLAGLTGLLVVFFAFYTARVGGSVWQILFAAGLGIIPALPVAIHLVNWVVMQIVPPKILPKMDYTSALPQDCKALVVVPAMLSDSREVNSLLRKIEAHFLRNSDPNLFFALLSDFTDASEQHLPEDEALVQQAVDGIQALNSKYPRPAGDPFLLLHRQRRWNPSEGCWMGWERKRGKLQELNQMILSGRSQASRSQARLADTGTAPPSPAFAFQVGFLSILEEIQYVITLDADTLLPQTSAHRLLAAMTHPLNRPVFNSHGEIFAGYSVLQPRTEISPTSVFKSRFSRLFSGDKGLDLYTLAVSDVYQDLFGEGSYVGKGIYDVEAFERSLAGRAPENSLLSHDLFEGVHGRTGLVTDVFLLEDYTSHYLAQARRMFRWMRGDWQLLPWLFPWVPGENGRLQNRLSVIDRWKIADNLRRSLLMPGLLLFFVAGWFGLLPGAPIFWTSFGLLPLAMPLLTSLLADLPRGNSNSFRDNFLRWLLAVAFLPYEALLAVEAAAVTLWRVLVSRRSLLQWTTAAQTDRLFAKRNGRFGTWMVMMASPVSAVLLFSLLAVFRPNTLFSAAPLLVLWFIAPEIAYRVSLPVIRKVETLSTQDHIRLRRLARRTWLFFERFVGPEDQWLPPDHYQETPLGTVAHRTSPTNIGLNLLTTLGAYELGYIGLLGLSARLRSSFDTLARMERYQGHFYNWYDTRSLELLEPQYISTVDSGNMAACLIALRQGLLALQDVPVLRWETCQGLLDALSLLQDHLESLPAYSDPSFIYEPVSIVAAIQARIRAVEDQPQAWGELLLSLSAIDSSDPLNWTALDRGMLKFVEECASSLDAESIHRLRVYTSSARQRLDNAQRELDILTPWISAFAHLPPLFAHVENLPELVPAWQALRQQLPEVVNLSEISGVAVAGQAALGTLMVELKNLEQRSSGKDGRGLAALDWCFSLHKALEEAALAGNMLWNEYQSLSEEAENFYTEMEFDFLYDPERKVFHIGFNQTLRRLDQNYYDLMASEARIASLVAIAKGDVPVTHWLHLGRPLTKIGGKQALISWSATMFEYLMPLLLVKSYQGTLLDESINSAVDIQIEYGHTQGTPWGISESGYYRFDPGQSYQYRAFGVPGLGFKRGLGDDLVIAPYASLLALPLRPKAVIKNLDSLKDLGAIGAFGLYEALDFTPERLPLGKRSEWVQEYMAHHQGMIFLSLVNFFRGNSMVEYFHRDPRIRSVELLLQEQIPVDVPVQQPHTREGRAHRPDQPKMILSPWRVSVNASQPHVHVLSNGRYRVLITASGGGYSAWQDFDLTRWRADTTLGGWGSWVYVQDVESRDFWSVGFEPTGRTPDHQDVYFNAHTVVFNRQDQGIHSEMEITVAPEEDVELRRLTLTNRGDTPRRLRLTSYAEVVLGSSNADRRHPAFSKLFVESEFLPNDNALLFRRRPRSELDATPFLAHMLVVNDGLRPTAAFEADRARFLGRGNTARSPQVLLGQHWLSGTAGPTLDPVMALGQEITLEPGTTVQLTWVNAAAPSRALVLALIHRYQAPASIEWAFQSARAAAEVELQQLGLHTTQLPKIQSLLSALLYPHPALRAPVETLRANRKGQPGLWPYAISGDYPILLARIASQDDLSLVHNLLQAHAFWRNRGLQVDLVFVNEQGANYGQELNGQLHRLFSRTGADAWLNRRGGIFLLLADQFIPEDRILLETAAQVVLDSSLGSLEEQLTLREQMPGRLPAFTSHIAEGLEPEPDQPILRPLDLQFDNGLGGFSPAGSEYVIYLEPGASTPAPWINVIANAEFGCLASEAGLGFTWAGNSGENRLTSWSNDPVTDPPGEALYLRDEETAQVWSPTPLPAPAPAPYLIRHGAGYTEYEHSSHGLGQRLRLFVVPGAPLKIVQFRVENQWQHVRRITLTYYVEWVLGVNREDSQQYLIPDYDGETQAILVRNPYNTEFGERVAFAAASHQLHGLTTDRTEFLGSLGNRTFPAGLQRIGLASTVQPGLDQCAALQVHLDLQPGKVEEVYFLLGQTSDAQTALALIRQYQAAGQVAIAWGLLQKSWDKILGAVTVRTPDPALDLMLNRWLLYQTLACRIWGRSAFYQSSGAYGFRDQLQDVMALVHAAPQLAREHILRAAGYQFDAGDVLHWWHPPSGRGVRTRFSDDLLWLPFVTAFYVASTGDQAILDEKAPFLTGPRLEPTEDEHYGQYASTPEMYTLYEHCMRAIEKGATTGPNGLPLMGSGDWNDGMNRVGHAGRGESIWLAWFLIKTLQDFARICELRGETDTAARLRHQAEEYTRAVEARAWDGAWYLRAFYDDGTPLGSAANQECQIDAIAQSWAVLSEAGNPDRVQQAMQAVSDRLIRPEDRLVLLFTPPFDRTPRDPGYIKGYLPGVRENGGQYTHAAIWTVWAFARLGQGDQAEALFRLLNPIYQADSPEKANLYKVEPYVVAADVYGAPPHTGRGGWTWYTGSAGWLYRLGIEGLLGLRMDGDNFTINPCIPTEWPAYQIMLKLGETVYEISVENSEGVQRGVAQISLDGIVQDLPKVQIYNDGIRHQVIVRLGKL